MPTHRDVVLHAIDHGAALVVVAAADVHVAVVEHRRVHAVAAVDHLSIDTKARFNLLPQDHGFYSPKTHHTTHTHTYTHTHTHNAPADGQPPPP